MSFSCNSEGVVHLRWALWATMVEGMPFDFEMVLIERLCGAMN